MKVSIVRTPDGAVRLDYDAEALAAPIDEREALLADARLMIDAALLDIEMAVSGLSDEPAVPANG